MTEENRRSNRRPFFLRLPNDLRHQLAQEAVTAERTLTAEIVFRLRRSIERQANQASRAM
jgi:hypothetical protein